MRLVVSFVVFSLIVSGVFYKSLASDSAGQHGSQGAETEGLHPKKKEIGVHQPPADLAKGTLPAIVKLVSPKALSSVSGDSVTLKWEAADRAEVYHVQVAKDPRFKWLVTENHNVKGESFDVSGLEAGHQYFWRVAGRSPGNDAGWTKGAFTASSFETK